MTGIKHIILMFLWIQMIESDHIQAPEDFQILFPNLGKVVLSWRPNVKPIAANRYIKYEVTIKTPDTEEEMFFTKHRTARRLLAVHRGLHATVKALLMEGNQNVSQSEQVYQTLPPFSGAEGTAVTDLVCHIKTDEFLKTSLTCSWTAGINAPVDTQYCLYYSYKDTTQKCFEKSQGEISIGCPFPFQQFSTDTSGRFLVHINGSSKSLTIQGFQHVYMAEHLEIINPPRNLTFFEREGTQILSWDPPYALSPHYFEYEVVIWNLKTGTNMPQIVTKTELENGPLQPPWKNHMIKVRAIRKTILTDKELYSNWTEPLHIENTFEDKINIYIIAGFASLTVTALVLIYVCLKFHLLKKMFPQVPKPKAALKELFLTPHRMDIVITPYGPEVISFLENMRDSENLDK